MDSRFTVGQFSSGFRVQGSMFNVQGLLDVVWFREYHGTLNQYRLKGGSPFVEKIPAFVYATSHAEIILPILERW